jgi:hypothetical protein
MRSQWLGIVLITLVCGAAAAEPTARFRGGSTMKVVLRGQPQTSLGLRFGQDGWRLAVDAAARDVADVVDITDGAAANKWVLEVVEGALVFDDKRFVADHAYRVTLRRGIRNLVSTIVYLHPRPASAKQKIKFDADDSGGGGDLDFGPKPSL